MMNNVFTPYGAWDESKYLHVTICGANIKPVSVKEKSTKIFGKRVFGNKIEWGVYIHCRVDDNKQIDLVFSLTDTFKSKEINMVNNNLYIRKIKVKKENTKIKKTKNALYVLPVIPNIFEACKVNEWVELIGKELILVPSTLSGYGILVQYDDGDTWIVPNYYEVHCH